MSQLLLPRDPRFHYPHVAGADSAKALNEYWLSFELENERAAAVQAIAQYARHFDRPLLAEILRHPTGARALAANPHVPWDELDAYLFAITESLTGDMARKAAGGWATRPGAHIFLYPLRYAAQAGLIRPSSPAWACLWETLERDGEAYFKAARGPAPVQVALLLLSPLLPRLELDRLLERALPHPSSSEWARPAMPEICAHPAAHDAVWIRLLDAWKSGALAAIMDSKRALCSPATRAAFLAFAREDERHAVDVLFHLALSADPGQPFRAAFCDLATYVSPAGMTTVVHRDQRVKEVLRKAGVKRLRSLEPEDLASAFASQVPELRERALRSLGQVGRRKERSRR